MKITFLGATRMVTGSCYLLEIGSKKMLLDCGIFPCAGTWSRSLMLSESSQGPKLSL